LKYQEWTQGIDEVKAGIGELKQCIGEVKHGPVFP